VVVKCLFRDWRCDKLRRIFKVPDQCLSLLWSRHIPEQCRCASSDWSYFLRSLYDYRYPIERIHHCLFRLTVWHIQPSLFQTD
jgi:hypothetical protein